MDKISEMINRHCHNEIKNIPLWEITAWDKKFNAVDSSMQKKIYKYNYLLAKELDDLVDDKGDIRILYTTDDIAYTTEEKAQGKISEGEVVAIPWGGNPTVKYYNGRFVTGDNRIATSLDRQRLDNKYLYYWMLNQLDVISNFYRGAGIKHPSMYSVLTMQIPLPPLPIQQEIVRILDSFTSMITNLETELASRQKQYEYYRNKLLTFDENDESVEWKTLGELGAVVRGNGLQKSDFSEEGVGCVHYGQIYTRLGFSIDKTLTFVPEDLAEKLTQVEPGNLIIACTSENVEDVCKSVVWLGSETIVTGGHACVFKHNENPKYVGYCFLTNNFFDQKQKYAYGAKVIDIRTEKLALIKIPIPSKERQQEIVSTLDTFESLISNIKQELDARKKQYEYYREKLLTFE